MHIMESLKSKKLRKTMANNYLSIWRSFNKFLIKLDVLPTKWEQRVVLYCTYLIEGGSQSQTIKSYVLAIKSILKDNGYCWQDGIVLLESLIRTCRIENDCIRRRLPIQIGLLELLLFEVQRYFGSIQQPYLEKLYKAIFVIMYYGLMRIGEVVKSNCEHTLRVKDMHVALNKDKILMILYSSKTHGKNNLPQKIKITALPGKEHFLGRTRMFCPFDLVRQYAAIRGPVDDDTEHFFVFKGKITIMAKHVRTTLRSLLSQLNLDPLLYNTQSFRGGRACDMLKSQMSIEVIKSAGRWQSNAIYKYLKIGF